MKCNPTTTTTTTTRRLLPLLAPFLLLLLLLTTTTTTAATTTTTHATEECPSPDSSSSSSSPKKVDVNARPHAPKLGDVLTNVKSKVVPSEVPSWLSSSWAQVTHIAAPHVSKLVQYGGEVMKPGEELAERCKSRKKTSTTGTTGKKENEAGLDACALLDVSWSLGQQLSSLGKDASSKTASWIAQEVPRVSLPFHLLWVDLAVDVTPVTLADVGSLILHQRPYWVVQLCDFFSEKLARVLHTIPLFDFVINARYDLLYVPDAACPLTQVDGLVKRAPLTPEGFCEVRPCARQSSISGQFAAASPFCECDLTSKICHLRAEPLRDFQLLVDEPLASKRFDAQATTSVAWVTVPEWMPRPVQVALQGVLPRYLFNFLVGVGLLYLAEPLAESPFFHVFLSGVLGMFSGLVVAGLVLNHLLRTVKRLQPFSGVATLLTSAAGFLLYQRFGRESIFPLIQQLLTALWADQKGQLLILGSAFVGVALTWGLGWFTETEDEARERPGWLRVYFNGQHNIRVGLCVCALSFLWRSVPTPDLGALVVGCVVGRGFLGHFFHRVHMYLNRSPETHRYLAQPKYHQARVGDEEVDSQTHTQAALASLRAYVQENPQVTHRVKVGRGDMDRFRGGGPDVVRDYEEEEEGGRGGGKCVVM